MKGLIRKDLYYLKTSWKPLALSILIMGIFATKQGYGAILMIVVPTFFGLSVMGCIQQDAQNKWYDYHKVLPLSLSKIVSSRYLAYLSFILLGSLIMLLYGYGVSVTMGITALGKNFSLWQGMSMGIAIALGFAAFFLPATYYQKGEKMEVSMMISGFVSFGLVSLATKVLSLLGISLMDYVEHFFIILFCVSILAFLLSWVLSFVIYQKRAYCQK